jgi:hypothetical protein
MKKLLYLLSLVSFLSYFDIPVGTLHAKYDQVLILIMVAVFVIDRFFLNRGVYIDRPGFLLLGLFGISIVSSAFLAPDSKYSLTQTLNLFSVSLVYILIPNVLRTHRDIADFIRVHLRFAKIWLIVSALVFVYSYITQTEVFGVNLIQNEYEPFGVYSTMLEPNIFGSFMLIIFALSFSLHISGSELPAVSRTEMQLIMYCSIVGVFISFTRAVWLGAIAGVALYYVLNSKNHVKSLYQIVGLAVLAGLILYTLSEVLKIEIVQYKLNNFFSSTKGTGIGRVVIWRSALDSWVDHGNLWFGNGTYSFATYFNPGNYEGHGNRWIGNLPLTFLHDSGLLGLGLFLLYYGHLVGYSFGYRKYHMLEDSKFIRDLSIGFLMALLGVFIAFFFTTGLSFSYAWILFGLVSAMNRVNKRELRNYREAAETAVQK